MDTYVVWNCYSVDQCRSAMKDLAAHPLTAASIARVIGMMTRHPSAAVDHTSLQASALLYFDQGTR